MQENKSEVARLRQQIDLEESAMRLLASGLAITANHEAINARMEIGANRVLQLVAQGKHEEARRLMDAPNWCVENEEDLSTDQTDTKPVEERSESCGTVGAV